jgi:hypothetical protein
MSEEIVCKNYEISTHIPPDGIGKRVVEELVVGKVDVTKIKADFRTVYEKHDPPEHYRVERAILELENAIVVVEREHYSYKADSSFTLRYTVLPLDPEVKLYVKYRDDVQVDRMKPWRQKIVEKTITLRRWCV